VGSTYNRIVFAKFFILFIFKTSNDFYIFISKMLDDFMIFLFRHIIFGNFVLHVHFLLFQLYNQTKN
jgi:hypothetical protein